MLGHSRRAKLIGLAARLSTIAIVWLYSAIASAEKVNDIAIVGADPAGSANGLVSAWAGGLPIKPRSSEAHHVDPFAKDQPLFVIDHANYSRYRPYLTEGMVALLETYPDSFEMPIYTSRRSASYPQWFYDNTRHRPVTRVSSDGNVLENAYPGVIFPHPKSGLEAIWNHLTRWRSRYIEREYLDAIVYRDGQVKKVRSRQQISFELFRKGEKGRAFQTKPNQPLVFYLSQIIAPAKLAGGALLAIDYLDQNQFPRKAWGYDVGQKRVRRLPYITFDNSALMTDSLRTADDTDMFNGSPERYQWNLLGKEIKYVPYNSYRLSSPDYSYDEILTPGHLNTELTRFEAHRVWVVEALLDPGKLHIYTKRRFYIDEDTWSILTVDQYDGRGNLWRVSTCHLKNFYEVPVSFCSAEVYHDLKQKAYNVSGLTNEEHGAGNYSKDNPPISAFTPAALRASTKR